MTPPQKMATFARVPLPAGQIKTVQLTFPSSRLAVTTGDITAAGKRRVRRGTYTLTAGKQSTTLGLY